MPRSPVVLCAGAYAIVAMLIPGHPTLAQTVWSGLSLSFTKASNADPLLPENQDRITGNVWLTRDVLRGIVNAATECDMIDGCLYTQHFSPEGTAWATGLIPANASQTIAATNWQNLTFTNWEAAYGNQVGVNILNRDAVVHLISDDVYLDLRFTGWAMQGGGSFTYLRSVPEPFAIFLMLIGLIPLAWARRRVG